MDTTNVFKRGSSSEVETCYVFDYIPDKRYRKYVTNTGVELVHDKELMIPESHVYRAHGEGVMNLVATDLAGEHTFGMPPAPPGISIRFVSSMPLGL